MPADFEEALRAAYGERPCEVLPNALWKTLQLLRRAEAPITAWDVGATTCDVRYLHARDAERLMVHWASYGDLPALGPGERTRLKLAILHERYIAGFPADRFASVSRYFRLVHRGEVRTPTLSAAFELRDVDGGRDAGQVASVINRCYEGMALTEGSVASWLDHPVYAPDLWIWVVDRETRRPVGLGIAELDPALPEASLEWVQVLPAYRRRGIGTALVCELLRRVEGRVAFTTVAGRLDNTSDAEALYRRCGFRGDDVWWVLQRPPVPAAGETRARGDG